MKSMTENTFAIEDFRVEIVPEAPSEYSAFWRLWREGDFFACHEEMENLWRKTTGRERVFLNGLVHAAVAIYQHRRGNAWGAARQLVRARRKLKNIAPHYAKLDAQSLLNALENEIESSLRVLSESQKSRLEILGAQLNFQEIDDGHRNS